jgi:acetate kinase
VNILIFNCGSSSQGFKVYQTAEGTRPEAIASGKAKNVATQTRADSAIEWKIQGQSGVEITDLPTHRSAAEQILALLQEKRIGIDAVGHRFVHGGTLFDRTAWIDEATLEKLKLCLPFAPIHNPNSFQVIEVCRRRLGGVPQYAVFDTSFHSRMPEAARQYAIPKDLAEQHGFRKYGFHGLSYHYVSARTAELLGRPLESLKLILCHLGTGGSSVVAVQNGISLDTSMGYSPLPGLVMSTRCGDIDAEIVLELVRGGRSPDEVDEILNYQSGLLGLSGYSSNIQEIIEAGEKGNAACRLAFDVYAHRLALYLGAYTWLLNRADAIVFTDTVGVSCWKLRQEVCGAVQNLGVEIDVEKNRNAAADQAERVSTPNSKTEIWSIPTDEELVIVNEVLAFQQVLRKAEAH